MKQKRNKKRNNGDGLIPLLIFFVCGRWYTIPISECLNTYLKFLFDWMILKPNALITFSYLLKMFINLQKQYYLMKDNFIEVKSVDEANKIDMNTYTFMERFSATRGMFVFKIREMKRI